MSSSSEESAAGKSERRIEMPMSSERRSACMCAVVVDTRARSEREDHEGTRNKQEEKINVNISARQKREEN